MASSAASMAASRVLNLRNSSLRSLIHRHILRPPAAAAASTTNNIITNTTSPEQQLFNHFYSEKQNPDLVNFSLDMKNLNSNAANLSQSLQFAIGFSAQKIEAARHRRKYGDSDGYGDSDFDDGKDMDYGDVMPDYDDGPVSGSDDDEDDDHFDDQEDDDAPPRRFRK